MKWRLVSWKAYDIIRFYLNTVLWISLSLASSTLKSTIDMLTKYYGIILDNPFQIIVEGNGSELCKSLWQKGKAFKWNDKHMKSIFGTFLDDL